MANKPMQRRSMSLAFWEVQIRTTVRNHPIPKRVRRINHQMLARMGGVQSGMFIYCWGECKVTQLEELGWLFIKLNITFMQKTHSQVFIQEK